MLLLVHSSGRMLPLWLLLRLWLLRPLRLKGLRRCMVEVASWLRVLS